ncbi:hypothetical protein OPS25_01660 [Alteromonas ponticola]|uniref:Uncharacterized protein n=1 Tax=Alteromonas aquimaris TaxID=2998417 RepID=A0ABT3P368_9ALTE|nr:hypothetical protein [Alteromonas aquimaris]MCW8107210.1 hypothetical protein [Alteromonas aquimaris]
MMKNLIRGVVFCFVSLLALQNTYADDHEPPFIGGEYWEVTGIKTADGGRLKYGKWLATEWKKNMEFAKSEGWITRYEVLANIHARHNEPDLYLAVMFKNMGTVEEDEQRRKKYMEWVKKGLDSMEKESGDRAEYRTVMSTVLLQEMKFRNK